MRLTDFLASVGRDYNLQQKFWHSEAPTLATDQEFQRLLGHHGWDNLDPDHRALLKEADLCKIQAVLVAEADVTPHQAGGFGPCWVLVRA
jgi:hypothetical protein